MSLTFSDNRSFFQSRFTQVDELARGLGTELETLRDCLTPLTTNFAMRVEQVSRTAAEIRERLDVLAGELDRESLAWSDRRSLEGVLDALITALEDRGQMCERLRRVAGQLEAGQFSHKVRAKAEQLHAARLRGSCPFSAFDVRGESRQFFSETGAAARGAACYVPGMDAIEQLKEELRQGRIDPHRLVELMVSLQRELQAAKQRIAELEKQLGGSPTAKIAEPFSMRAEEKRQQARGKTKRKAKRKGRRGRFTTADKVLRAERVVAVWPDGVDKSPCHWSHVRPVWRLENGRVVLIAYHIYRGPNNRYGKISGVLGRSEFGMEIVVAIAYLVYVGGLSFDKVCLVLNFFQNLKLGKSQADALLQQLSRHWQNEFEILCTLLANALVVHTDETSWSLNSVWAFLSEKARLLFFGVHKDADTLKAILDPATFAGLVFSDDAAIYANFTAAQKCWAQLLRKAIKLTLQAPGNLDYRNFADRLLEIYRAACRVQRDGRFRDAGRTQKVADLDDEILELCGPLWAAELPPLEGADNDYRLRANELRRLMRAQQLFTLVTAQPATQPNGIPPPLDATNNEAERTLRNPAAARQTGRTNQTIAGARRQTILTSVLESLRLYLPTFTLASVLAEIERWIDQGRSCFTALLNQLKIRTPQQSVLDQVLPNPSG